MNPGVASVQIMQIGPFVAMRIVSMAMRAIHQKQMPALRCIGAKLRRLDCSLSIGYKRRDRNRGLSVSHDRRNSEHADERRRGGADRQRGKLYLRSSSSSICPASQWPSNISPPKNPAAPINEQPINMVARYSVNARREGSRPTRKRHVARPTIRVKAGQTK